MSTRYSNSETLLKRALQSIPLGSQTFSKSKTQLAEGASPFFAKKADGAVLTDVDGNEYIDFVNSLAAITLGYNKPEVVDAVKEQLALGTIFSLPSDLEVLVAEKIISMVPCAEMVRFGKNGSDATTGAIRVARAHTGRDHILVCGYHGWQDWYIGSTLRNKGVPHATVELTHKFEYNNIQSLERKLEELSGKIAAVILEPMNVFFPEDNFLEKVKTLTHKHGALLIFDETITGFRFSAGGAQEYFGVTPDLATFGKGLANGFPLSAVAGKKEFMKQMEDIFFSFTFGGETLSLAASLATLDLISATPVLDTIKNTGEYLIEQLQLLIKELELEEYFKVYGHPSWTFLIFQDNIYGSLWELKTLLQQEMFARGIYTIGTHNISYAHTQEHVDSLISGYRHFFNLLIDNKSTGVSHLIKTKVLEPLFKVR